MKGTRSEMKMPELLVFAKVFLVGIISAEVFRIAYYLGENFAPTLSEVDLRIKTVFVFTCLFICIVYVLKRKAHLDGIRLYQSYRVDLLIALVVGIWANDILSPSLDIVHKFVQQANSQWAPAILSMLLLILISSLFRADWSNKKKNRPQLFFLEDEEIKSQEEDVMSNGNQAMSFAQTVLESGGAHSGLVFGIDGPWGVGKTSFINLAELYWKTNAEDEVIVFRFEPLRYASEADLSQRFIKELSAVIQKEVYAPEFQPIASRYSRMLKGKADLSFLGFKVSLEPTNETIDEMLEDIDEVLKRIGRRLIVVIDDLDRLEPKSVNNVLFTIRRTFKLSQATYIICYDLENLIVGKDDGEKAREFLEKFVTLKLSLFVDSSTIKKYLRRDWSNEESALLNIPADSMLKLSGVLDTLAEIMDSGKATKYMPILGDLRKVKRFVNAVLLMQIQKTNLDRTDFSREDLINLLLLHLNYPGIFRRIYVEETEGRSGMFSISRNFDEPNFSNSEDFTEFVKKQDRNASFLLKQLFDVEELKLDLGQSIDEAVVRSRACFNHEKNRNLENYLKLIVRFVKPEPRKTFVLYQKVVEAVKVGNSIKVKLDKPEFNLNDGENAHDQFWRLLVNQSYDFTSSVAEDAINTLIDYLPEYSFIETPNIHQGLRSRSIYSLIHLLDRAGWGRTSNHRLPNSHENIAEIAHRIFGEGDYEKKGIISRLASEERGVLGWEDLMSFRLACSADRQGQLHNVYSALILHEDNMARTDGLVSELTLKGMRMLSQKVFALFNSRYIEPKRNFLTEVDETLDEAFLGSSGAYFKEQEERSENPDLLSLSDQLAIARSSLKVFVIYQLSNNKKTEGSGAGCGLYDEQGQGDSGGIGKQMSKYMFDICFNPNICEKNIFHFTDHCLLNLGRSYSQNGVEYLPTKADLPGGLVPSEMAKYWQEQREFILKQNLTKVERRIVTSNYIATYSEDLQKVFDVLDEISKQSDLQMSGKR